MEHETTFLIFQTIMRILSSVAICKRNPSSSTPFTSL